MKGFLIFMAIVFALATIILYNSSINKLDSYTARQLGVSSTINIQATVFCAACAIMCVVNIIGAAIISAVEKNRGSADEEPEEAEDEETEEQGTEYQEAEEEPETDDEAIKNESEES